MKWRIAACGLVAIVMTIVCWSGDTGADVSERVNAEYKIVPAAEFGIKNLPSGGSVFNYDGAADKLNELAGEGWRYRDFLSNGTLSAVLLERHVNAD